MQNQIAELSRQIVKTPQNAELHLRRGELHRIRRNWDAALADYKAAEKLDPELTAVTLCRGKLHLDSGQPDKAIQMLDRFLRLQPDHPEALVSRGRALILLGQNAEAAIDFSRA
ncbi:MAG TPA: tetratricopeptide repeat protein, partial [Acidobacteriota bacterium]|nr:tetratricopeptide repeat protein [Acidobacteriota bacterium]